MFATRLTGISHPTSGHFSHCFQESVFVHTMDDSADGRVFATIVEAYMILENVSEINIQGKDGSVEINCGEA